MLSIELAVATPAFLDLTFVGLESLPAPGEERFAGELMRSPGGGAITAVAAARLGLQTALVAPLGNDLGGEYVRRELEAEGVAVAGFRTKRTPGDGRDAGRRRSGRWSPSTPAIRARAADVAALTPVAIAANLDQLDLLPNGTRSYLTCGDDDARAFSRQLPPQARSAPARSSSTRPTRSCSPTPTRPRRPPSCSATGSRRSSSRSARERAIAVTGGQPRRGPRLRRPARSSTPPATATCCAPPTPGPTCAARSADERLSWAQLYSRLAMGVPTATGGAVTEERLLEEGAQARPLRPSRYA